MGEPLREPALLILRQVACGPGAMFGKEVSVGLLSLRHPNRQHKSAHRARTNTELRRVGAGSVPIARCE